MPYVFPRPRLRRAFGALAGAVVLASAIPAVAGACTVSGGSGSEVFSSWGDNASYVLAPVGWFESGTSGWTLKGASVVSGNESYYVHSKSDSHSLSINATGTAISAPICISSANPYFRFFAREISGSWAEVNVYVLRTDSSGAHSEMANGMKLTTSWAPSAAYPLGEMLASDVWQTGSTLSIQLELVPSATGGNIAIDDVYVDPYGRS